MTTEFTPIDPKTSQAVQDFIDFFSDIESRVEAFNTSLDLRNIAPSAGTKLYLEVTLQQPELYYFLFKWLHGTALTEPPLVCGCRLEVIHSNPPGIDKLKEKLQLFLDEM